MFLDMVWRFHEAGVPLTTGSDLDVPWITAGPTFHRGLELLVSTGISPLDVISIATRNAARFLEVEEDVGAVAEGRRADLVVLNANPLENISNTKAVDAVFFAGRRVDQ